MKRIPYKWTKRMFLSASFYALQDADIDVRLTVASDLHLIALLGFSFWRSMEFCKYSVDYTKYKTDLFFKS